MLLLISYVQATARQQIPKLRLSWAIIMCFHFAPLSPVGLVYIHPCLQPTAVHCVVYNITMCISSAIYPACR